MTIVYLPVVRRKFDAELAQQRFTATQAALQLAVPNLVSPAAPLGEPAELLAFIETLDQEPTALIVQQLTFTGQEFIDELISRYAVPVLLLAEEEPSVHGWLHLNALTGLLSTANALHTHGLPYQQYLGGVDTPQGAQVVRQFVSSVQAYQAVHHLTLGVVSDHPTGFDFSGTVPWALTQTFGVQLKHYSIDQAFAAAEQLAPADYAPQLEYARQHLHGLEAEDPRAIKMAQYLTVMHQKIDQDHLGALASRCWPDFFDKFDSAPGGVFSQLTAQLTPVAEEGDIHGAVSMAVLQALTGNTAPAFLGDVTRLDPTDNTVTLWHDYGAYQLCNPDYPATAGVHPNRHVGVSVDGALKPGPVTLLRVHWDQQGYRLLSLTGRALAVEPQFNGVSGKVQVTLPVTQLLDRLAQSGAESHFALIYGDYAPAITWLGRWLGVPVTTLDQEG
ncbi:fucose isomerase [Levilactobacillus zymae]|uniref:Fucose isomerase n=1 Tax=Levilactobacillus zymae TaxID=267363 RepID=A0ABQ0WUT5_9LACO|nr:hypothetical protein [Levilactobacillus zymae]KRL11288.1 hypothetical protein FD38_GL001802 [Levilactobacillus zymae DSM 19395]QFR60178.1 hypothetical protein LZ395_00860 [Levilactobacillus zymae]GEO71379.1 fucose isomerase [Levilactobacillus zymae]